MTQIELDIKMSEIEQEEMQALKPLKEKKERLQHYKEEAYQKKMDAMKREHEAGLEILNVCGEIFKLRASFRTKKHELKKQFIENN